MDLMRELRTRKAALVSAVAASALVAVGCGGEDDFENEPRPPVPLQLTGVITEESVTVSPRTVAPGPIVLIVSNQTDNEHIVTLEGPEVDEKTGEIPPADTATLQATLRESKPGEGYEVRANSTEGAVDPEELIAAATIRIVEKSPEECERIEDQGRSDPTCRGSSSDELLLP
jgi:hypothetical protein